MNVDYCPRCDRIFAKGLRDICPACHKEIEDQLLACIAYLRENKQATLNELSEGTDVSIAQINKFIREGRIDTKSAAGLELMCDGCGQPVRGAFLCRSCQSQLMKDIQNINSNTKAAQTAVHHGGAYGAVDRFRGR